MKERMNCLPALPGLALGRQTGSLSPAQLAVVEGQTKFKENKYDICLCTCSLRT